MITLAPSLLVAQPNYRFQHFDTNDGLPSKWAWSIAQDSLGFIWIQYYGGLSRYDGYSFKVYKHDVNDTVKSLPGGIIGKIVADHSGNIWVTEHHSTETLSKYDRKTDAFIKYEPDLKGATVNGFRFDKKKPIIWFATNGKGLFSFNSETLETKNYLNGHPDALKSTSSFIWDISDRDSYILLASSSGLWRFDKETKAFSRPKCNPADSTLLYHSSVWKIDDGPTYDYNNVWLHVKGALLNVNNNLSVIRSFDFPVGFDFVGFDRDKDGILWIATLNNGLYRYNPWG